MNLAQQIKDKALGLGFDAVGITNAAPVEADQAEHFRDWLDAGFAGAMAYMGRNVDKRLVPTELLTGAQSVVIVALNYKPTELDNKPDGLYGRVSQYACYDDYHDFMKPLLHELAAFIRELAGEPMQFKVCVDSVPLAERALAVRAGLGFIGRNHMLIHPTLGPQIFLGEIVATVRLDATGNTERDTPTEKTCTGCNRCVRACPTGALRADGRFDARRCISYLTMEHKGEIESELAARIGNRLFGCDECVMACPHHTAAPSRTNAGLRFYPERQYLDLRHILEMPPEQFDSDYAHSPIHRRRLDGLKQNARICIENLKSK